jgi:hypothetical protein
VLVVLIEGIDGAGLDRHTLAAADQLDRALALDAVRRLEVVGVVQVGGRAGVDDGVVQRKPHVGVTQQEPPARPVLARDDAILAEGL